MKRQSSSGSNKSDWERYSVGRHSNDVSVDHPIWNSSGSLANAPLVAVRRFLRSRWRQENVWQRWLIKLKSECLGPSMTRSKYFPWRKAYTQIDSRWIMGWFWQSHSLCLNARSWLKLPATYLFQHTTRRYETTEIAYQQIVQQNRLLIPELKLARATEAQSVHYIARNLKINAIHANITPSIYCVYRNVYGVQIGNIKVDGC